MTGASLIKGWAAIPESYVTQVPILTLDRILGDMLHNKKVLILVDIEGAEYMMLQGAETTMRNDPAPIWIMEITATTHQPEGVEFNPNFKKTFEMFFAHGYRAQTADRHKHEITSLEVANWLSLKASPPSHNFVFRK